jgi:multidrug efflux pump subunit AcrB
MRHLVRTIVSNSVLANLALCVIIGLGVMALMNLRRESMPPLSVDIIQVNIPYRGADPAEVEEGVSRRVEAVLDGMQGIIRYHTASYEGMSNTQIEVREGYEVQEVRDRVENAVASIDTFPQDVENPRYTVVTQEEEVIDLALWGDLSERQLKSLADEVIDELQQLPEVSLVKVMGGRPYELNIEVSKDRLREYNLSLADVTNAIERTSLNLSSGAIKGDGEDIRIRTLGRRYKGREFESIIVKTAANGSIITLDRIATISDSFVEDGGPASYNGHPCQLIYVEKAPGEDSIAISEAVRAYADSKQRELPPGVNVTVCFDQSEFIRGQISMLTRNGLVGLVLVLFVLWLFLETRLAFWIAMGIPISLSGALVIMWMIGLSINQFSLMTMIVVLGIIVDDAIVVGEAIYSQRRQGKPALQAAADGVMEVGAPVIAAVTTTIIAFLPLAFVPGIMGKFMVMMPIIVISALLVSLVECLFMLPAHLNHLPQPRTGDGSESKLAHKIRTIRRWPGAMLEKLARSAYAPVVRKAVHHRYVTLCAAFGLILVTIGLLQGQYIRVVFWPPADGNHLSSQIEFPPGTRAEVTQAAIDRTREAFENVAAETQTSSGKPLVRTMFTWVSSESPNSGTILIEMIEPEDRGVHSQDLTVAWEEKVGQLPGVVSHTFDGDSIGMGGAPIEIWLQAKDIDVAKAASEELKEKLRTYDGVYQIEDDFRPGKTEVRVRLKPDAHLMGLTLADVATFLRTGYYGDEPERLQRGRDDVRVRVRYPREERQTIDELERARIRTPAGHEIPLISVAHLELKQGYSTIHGTNGRRRIAVTANTDINRANPSEVIDDLKKNYLDGMIAQHPSLSWSVQGVEASNQETAGGLQRGFLIAVFGIFVVMAAIFRSYLQPLLIVIVIPFGVIGAFWGHMLLGIPVTLISLFGIVALAGVVVNDNIVLIERINGLLAKGMPFYEAVCEGGVRRFRPIFLTTLSTSIGLLPVITETNLQAQIVIPMAVSISAGVAFATVLTLLFIPAMMGIFNDARRLVFAAIYRRWPTPEEVEPATRRGGHAIEETKVTTALGAT